MTSSADVGAGRLRPPFAGALPRRGSQSDAPTLAIAGFGQHLAPGLSSILDSIGGFDQLLAHGLASILDGMTIFVSTDRLSQHIEPDVLMLADAMLHDAEPLTELRGRHPNARLLILASEPSDACGRLSLACGVSCIAANAPVAAIRGAISLTARGGCVFIGSCGSVLRDGDPDCPGPLTAREAQTLTLLVRGLRYAGIARALDVKVGTAKKHGASLREKLNVQRTKELVQLPLALLGVTHGGQ
jgi:DNA-binding NarL/FixJ family response regulator